MTVRVDDGLKKWFVSYSRAKFGSTCKAVESLMAALYQTEVVRQKDEVYRSNTDGERIVIGKIEIERNLTRERRNLRYESCSVGACRDEAKFRVQFRGREFLVCANHRYDYWKLKDAVVVLFEQKLGEVGAQ